MTGFGGQDDDAPLELAELPPRPPAPPPPPTNAEIAQRRRRRRWVALAVTLALVGGGAGLLFTERGRAWLPKAVQRPAARLADDVEDRATRLAADVEEKAREAASDALYTYTDDDGMVHIVDSLEKIPPRHRAAAQRHE